MSDGRPDLTDKEQAQVSRAVERALTFDRARRPVQRILAASDFSEGADEAWQLACEIAERHGAGLILLHVLPEPPPPPLGERDEAGQARQDAARDAELALDKRVRQAWRRGVSVTPRLRAGPPAETIADTASAERADLVVLGARGLRGVPRLLVGHVAERVLRLAPCPVLVVKRDS